MALELKILNPQDGQYLQRIEWNYNEVIFEVTKALDNYKGVVYTETQISDAKKDRATLNKFVQAMEAKRKEIKKAINVPYETFEKEVKEVTGLVNQQIRWIDDQLYEYEEQQKEEKKKEIERLFSEAALPEYATLEKIWNPKWLNKTYSLKTIEEELGERKQKIETAVTTIKALPEFSQEALILFEDTLDVTSAIMEAKRLTDVKNAAEERRKAEEAKMKEAEAKNSLPEESGLEEPAPIAQPEQTATPQQAQQEKPVRRQRVLIEIIANETQFGAINDFYKALKTAAEAVRIVEKEEI